MYEDEAMKVCTFSSATSGLFGGKKSYKSDIGHLPDYEKWRNKYLQTGLVYEINKMLDTVHWDIKIIIAM